MFILKTLARELILPPSFLLLLILIGALLVWRRRRLGWAVLIAGFAALWLLCTPFVSERVAALAERCPALNPNESVNAQAVVVLGGGGERNYAPEYGGPMAEPVLLERLTLAAYLARHYSLPVAVSGAPRESVAMAATLTRNFEVTPRWIEADSRDTFENARLSAKMLFPANVKRIILVTSSPHEWRAVKEFEAAGFEVLPAPAGVSSAHELGIFSFVPSAGALQRSYAAVYELIGEPVRRLLAAGGVR
ncbi:MAG: YdcF family protein [Proteobacteria bacterium]|nr:YdcF family protein [Pseudomonadota bacterium]